MEIIGLLLNVFGALLLAFSADIQAKLFETLINKVADEKFGTFGMIPIPNEFKNNLKQKQKRNKILNITGYILFFVGAVLQLISICGRS